jgi:hypothetical protein
VKGPALVHLELEAMRFRLYMQRKFKLSNAQWQKMYRYWKRSGMLVALYKYQKGE